MRNSIMDTVTRITGGVMLALVMAAGLRPLTPVAQAASGPHPSHTSSPNAYSCSDWITIASAPIKHTYGVATYTGNVYLQKLIDPVTGAYCGEVRAQASLSTPTGALSATVKADLHYEISNSYHDAYGSVLTASSGNTVYSTSGAESSVQCADAYGIYVFPDTNGSYDTALICSF